MMRTSLYIDVEKKRSLKCFQKVKIYKMCLNNIYSFSREEMINQIK